MATTIAQFAQVGYYGYLLAKELWNDFKRSSRLPLDKDIYVTFALVTVFKEGSWPKFKEVEDEVVKVLNKYGFSKSKGTLTLKVSEKEARCAVEYRIGTNFLLPFDEDVFPTSKEDYEDMAEELYELTIATDLTVFIIPDLTNLSKEESKKIMGDILGILNALKSKLQEKFVVKKSVIRLKLQFKDEKTAQEIYNKLKEVISSKNIITLANVPKPALTKEGAEINIRDADPGIIEALFSIKFRRFPPW